MLPQLLALLASASTTVALFSQGTIADRDYNIQVGGLIVHLCCLLREGKGGVCRCMHAYGAWDASELGIGTKLGEEERKGTSTLRVGFGDWGAIACLVGRLAARAPEVCISAEEE